MPIINEYYQARSEITAFSKLNSDSFAFSMKYHGAKFIMSKECGVSLSFKDENLNFNTTAVCFSPDSQLIAFATKTHLHIANIQRKQIIKSIYLGNNHLTILSFDLSSTYIIAGSEEGKVLLYKYSSNSQLSELCSFAYKNTKTEVKKSFVSSIAFHKNLLAVSGYGGSIFIIDIYTYANKVLLLHGTSRKNALYFLNENTIVNGDNEGNLQFISIETNRVLKNINLPFKNTNQIVVLPNTSYLVIHSSTKRILIVNANEYKIIHNNYIEFEDNIYKIQALDSKTLIVCLQNQKILHIELPSRERLSSLIGQNKLSEAYNLIKREPMLQNSLEHKTLEAKYEKAYQAATDALINQNKSLANQLLDPFIDTSYKKDSIESLYKAFENYSRFKALYLEKKYALAYAMSSKFPALKLTMEYQSMERNWKETFTNAQRHILLGKPDYAKALFNEYITVTTKRPIIQLILKHNDLFIDFLKAFEKKDFKRVNEISQKNALFTQIPIYKTLKIDIQKSIKKIQTYIKKNKIDLAKKDLAKIENTPGFKDEVNLLYIKCEDMITLQELYEKDDFYSCYELIDSCSHLCFSQLGEFLQKHWIKLIHQCEDYALKGNIEGIKAVLGELITLSARKDKVGDLLRVSFQVQIKYFLAKKKFKSAQSVMYTYIDLFAKDSEISSLMHMYESLTRTKLAITYPAEDKVSKYSWMNSDIIID